MVFSDCKVLPHNESGHTSQEVPNLHTVLQTIEKEEDSREEPRIRHCRITLLMEQHRGMGVSSMPATSQR